MANTFSGLHWLALTVSGISSEDVEYALMDLMGVPLENQGGARWFSRRMGTVGDGGSAYFLSGHRGDGGDLASINLTGSALEGLTYHQIDMFLRDLEYRGATWKVSRVDYALDGLPLSVTQFRDALLDGQITCRAHSYKYYENGETDLEDDKRTVSNVTYGLAIGSRASNRYVRVYDRRGTNRLEVELKNEDADLFFRAWFAGSGLVDCFVDLLHHLFTLLPQVLEDFLLSMVDTVREYPRVKRVKATIAKKVQWLFKSVAKTYSGLLEVFPNIGEGLRYNGQSRLSKPEREFYRISSMAFGGAAI